MAPGLGGLFVGWSLRGGSGQRPRGTDAERPGRALWGSQSAIGESARAAGPREPRRAERGRGRLRPACGEAARSASPPSQVAPRAGESRGESPESGVGARSSSSAPAPRTAEGAVGEGRAGSDRPGLRAS